LENCRNQKGTREMGKEFENLNRNEAHWQGTGKPTVVREECNFRMTKISLGTRTRNSTKGTKGHVEAEMGKMIL
jgi:hypothetical protein